MEDKPIQPTSNIAPQNPVPAEQPMPTVVEQTGGGEDKKIVMWLILGLIVIILVVVGVYLFLSKQPAQPTPAEQTQPGTSSTESLENDINSIDVKAADDDFKSVDADLQTL